MIYRDWERVMSDKRSKALAIISKMLPASISKGFEGQKKELGNDLGELAMVGVFDQMWTREGLDLRTRSLITCAMLIPMRANSELEIHFPAAVRNGATIADIEELIYQSAGYAGFPAATNAREVARMSLKAAGMVD
jgi:4-carboxymuconolactone decarboxylase